MRETGWTLPSSTGNAIMGSVEDTSIAEARAQLETNFFGALRVCRAVVPHTRAQGGGHIINVSSLADVLGLPFSASTAPASSRSKG